MYNMAKDFDDMPFSGKKGKDDKGDLSMDRSDDFIQLGRRIKVVEEGINNLRKKMLVNEQNDISRHKKILTEEKTTLSEVNELKKEIEEMNRIIKEVINELRNGARKEDVEVLRKYIDMWNPINFVTEETVEKMIDEKLNNL
jgi:predicted phage-related endonuclease